MSFELYSGDCVEVMKRWPEACLDAVCTDPPYLIDFMGKKWDSGAQTVFGNIDWHRRWTHELLRVMKPGAFAFVFSHSRAVQYLMVALELVGFEIRDTIDWFYFNGFPKNLDLGDGRGTALKPMKEPIVLVQKPREGTFEQNIATYGTGYLNIDACKIEVLDKAYAQNFSKYVGERGMGVTNWQAGRGTEPDEVGRWPPNVIIDELVAFELDARCGETGAKAPVTGNEASAASTGLVTNARKRVKGKFHGDKGGPSRFIYCVKPTKAEREFGCEGLPLQSAGDVTDREDGSAGLKSPRAGAGRLSGSRNIHPTLKPINLMRYLSRMITPRGGLVADPFMGSGTTGIAALREGFDFIGVEKELQYLGIAAARVSAAEREQREQGQQAEAGTPDGGEEVDAGSERSAA